MKPIYFCILLFFTLPALAQEETPMAAPVAVVDATAYQRLTERLEKLDAERAELRAQLARNEAILLAVLVHVPEGEVKAFVRWYLERIRERVVK